MNSNLYAWAISIIAFSIVATVVTASRFPVQLITARDNGKKITILRCEFLGVEMEFPGGSGYNVGDQSKKARITYYNHDL